MKTIKIFLASSDELKPDRDAFGNLVRRLDKIYEKRGVRIDLFEWEDYDAAYNNVPKQDEYDEQVRASDMFLALFHIKGGKFTIREFNVATEEFRNHASPKVFVYCKDLQPGEKESAELADFKRVLYQELGHYWCRYGNSDTMQLHFVMQLQLVENSRMDALKVEEDGRVTLDGMRIAHMNQLPFAAGNEAYQKMSAELLSLPDEIEKARQRAEKYPDDEDLKDELQKKLNRYNQLKEEFKHLQENLFATAKMITNLQLQQVNARVRRAIEAFEAGDLERANTILEENAREADSHMERLEQEQELVHQDIDAFQLQAKTFLADVHVPIADRIERVAAIYAKADDWARRSTYDKEKYAQLLSIYANFLKEYAHYEEAKQIYLRLIPLSEEIYGLESEDTATSYNNIGGVYSYQGDYTQALGYYFKALPIYEHVLNTDHPNTATLYNNIGCVCSYKGDYSQALEYHFKALAINERVLGTDHPSTSSSCNNIGFIYCNQGDYTKALEYYFKALAIDERELGTDHPSTAGDYNNIGAVYDNLGDYPQALDYYFKALAILERTLGTEHPNTASSYNNIGGVYYKQGDYSQALEYYFKALAILERTLGTEHPNTASSYNNIGGVYDSQGDYPQALDYYFKSLAILERILGTEHPNIASSYNNIGGVYDSQGDYPQALDYYFKALGVRERVLGTSHPDTATSYNNIGLVYYNQGDCSRSLEYLTKALAILEQVLGAKHPNTLTVKESLADVKETMRQGSQPQGSRGGFFSRLFGKKK